MEENKLQVPLVEKTKGGELYRSGDYAEASKCYASALRAFKCLIDRMLFENEEQLKNYVEDIQLPCLLNISACYLKLNISYEDIIEHCTNALHISPNNAKALYRRAIAYTHLCEFELARKDLICAAKEEPNNTSIQQAWEELKELRQQYRLKQKRLAQLAFRAEPVAEYRPISTWLEVVKGIALVCRSRFY